LLAFSAVFRTDLVLEGIADIVVFVFREAGLVSDFNHVGPLVETLVKYKFSAQDPLNTYTNNPQFRYSIN